MGIATPEQQAAWDADQVRIREFCATLPEPIAHHMWSHLTSTSDVPTPPSLEMVDIVDGKLVDYEAWATKAKVELARYKAAHPGKYLKLVLSPEVGLSLMGVSDNMPNPLWDVQDPLSGGSTPMKLYRPGEDDKFWGEINKQFVEERAARRAS